MPIVVAGGIGILGGAGGTRLALECLSATTPLDHRDNALLRGAQRTSEAQRLIGLLRTAADDGLDPARYSVSQLEQDLADASDAAALNRAERRLSAAVSAYARDLRVPQQAAGVTYVDPALVPRPVDLAGLPDGGASERLRSAQTGNLLYQELRAGLAWYRSRWSGLPQIVVEPGAALTFGSSGSRVATLRRRLGLAPAPARFDGELAGAVTSFREVHGLGASPVADGPTIAALNLGSHHYERLIALNLDRVRGFPLDAGRYIVVDAVGAMLRMIERGKQVDAMRVVVGKPEMPTPQLAGSIRFAVLNPYWNIPPDLVRQSVVPQVQREGSAFLSRHRYVLFSDWRASAPDRDAEAVDWNAVAAGTEKIWIRQSPGGGNMMGEVKFMLPNQLGIYLHDTPRKADFGRVDRRLSSGCVRLENARRLGRWLFGHDPLAAADGTPEKRVDLPQPVPVFITYLTAVPQGGQVRFQPDVYGRDRAALAK